MCVHVCMSVCACVSEGVCMRVHVCLYEGVCVHVCMSVCACVCMHVDCETVAQKNRTWNDEQQFIVSTFLLSSVCLSVLRQTASRYH